MRGYAAIQADASRSMNAGELDDGCHVASSRYGGRSGASSYSAAGAAK